MVKPNCLKLRDIVSVFAIGKFDRGLYINGNRFQSSLIAGLLTLIITILLTAYAVFVFTSITKRDDYRMDQSLVDLKHSGFEEVTIGDFLKNTFKITRFEIVLEIDTGFSSCNDVEFNVSYKNSVNMTFESTSNYSYPNFAFACYFLPGENKEY